MDDTQEREQDRNTETLQTAGAQGDGDPGTTEPASEASESSDAKSE